MDFRGLNIILLDYVCKALDHHSLVLDRVYTLTSAEVLAGYLPALTNGVRRAGVVIPWRDDVREGEGGQEGAAALSCVFGFTFLNCPPNIFGCILTY